MADTSETQEAQERRKQELLARLKAVGDEHPEDRLGWIISALACEVLKSQAKEISLQAQVDELRRRIDDQEEEICRLYRGSGE